MLEASRAGDASAWSALQERFKPVIVAGVVLAMRSFGPDARQQMDDLLQEAVLKLCAEGPRVLQSARFEHPNSAFEFIKKMAWSTAFDYLRHQKPARDRETVSLDQAWSDPGTNAAERRLMHGLSVGQVQKVLEHIVSPSTRERDTTVFWLHHRQGWTARELAAVPAFGLGVKGVESLLFRLTSEIRQHFSSTLEDSGPAPRLTRGEP